MVKNYTIFISDLHLSAGEKKTAQAFFDFMEKKVQGADALYILGDLFMLWIGDDDKSVFHEKVKAAIRRVVENGTPVFIMPGNRDFLLGEDFCRECGAKLLPMMTVIELYGKKTLLTHGDNLCGKNAFHTRFRIMVSNERNKKLFLLLPLFIRRTLAWLTHGISFACNMVKSKSQFMDKTRSEAIAAMIEYDVDQIIHGHIHKALDEEIEVNGKKMQRIVLGEWEGKAECRSLRSEV